MKAFIIFVEDRCQCDNKFYLIESYNIEDAKMEVVKKFLPYFSGFEFHDLVEMMERQDIYITIVEQDKIIRL